MSRTYRIRHLPRVAGGAKHYVDSSVRQARESFEEKHWGRVAHDILKLPCLRVDERKYGYRAGRNQHLYACIISQVYDPEEFRHFTEGFYMERSLETRGYIHYPVSKFLYHPDVGYGLAGIPSRIKKAGRKHVHRRLRRKNKVTMARLDLEDAYEDGLLFDIPERELSDWAWTHC